MIGLGLSIVTVAVNALVRAAGGGGGVAATWDPATLNGAAGSLSVDKLTVFTPDADTYTNVRSTTSRSTGKVHVEATLTFVGPADGGETAFGIVPSTWDYTDVTGSGLLPGLAASAFLGYVKEGAADATQTFYTAPMTSGQTAAIEADLDAGKGWIKDQGATGWIGGGDPAAGTSPSFTFTPGTFYVGAQMYSGDDSTPVSVEVNLGASAFSVAVSTGFSAWNAA